MEHLASKDITALLVEWSKGNPGAINDLTPLRRELTRNFPYGT